MRDPYADLEMPPMAGRAERLAPDIVQGWTEAVRRLALGIVPGRRPCDWRPWQEALDAPPPPLPHRDPTRLMPSEHLRFFAAWSAQPRWPEGRRDLVEWALTYLEADVMLFRSGYAKKNLLTRLRQTPLTRGDVARVGALLHRAILQGTGLEEQRGYRRLAAHLVCDGALPQLREWLVAQAEGAVLLWGTADGAMIADLRAAPLLPEDRGRLDRVSLLVGSKWGVVFPALSQVVPMRPLCGDVDQKRRLSAYRVFTAIRRREGALPTR